jgi:hypothetical protein
MPGMLLLAGSPPNVTEPTGSTGDNFDPGEFRTKPLGNSGERAGRAGSHKNPINLIEFAGDFVSGLFGVSILIGYVCVLIEPDRVWIQTQYFIDLP